MVDVLLDLGGATLWARITDRSRRRLALAEGSRVYALIKAVAPDSHGFGRAPAGSRPKPRRSLSGSSALEESRMH